MAKRLLVTLLYISILFVVTDGLFAANYKWIQTDWFGNSGQPFPEETTGHNSNDPLLPQGGQTQWNKYHSKDSNVVVSRSDGNTDPTSIQETGQIRLSPFLNNFAQTPDWGSCDDVPPGPDCAGEIVVDGGLTGGVSTDGVVHDAANPFIVDSTKSYTRISVINGGVVTGPAVFLLSAPTGLQVTRIPGTTGGPSGALFYVVTAVDATGFETPRSGQVSIGNTQNQLNLRWDPVPGASGYRLYRASGSPTYYISPSLVCETRATDPAPTNCVDAGQPLKPGAPHLVASLVPVINASLSSGGNIGPGTYYYALTAVDYWGFETPHGTQDNVFIASSTGAVSLGWISMPEAVKYRVYRSKIYNVYNNPSLVCETTQRSCTDTLATPMDGAPPRTYDNAFYSGTLRLKVSDALLVDATSKIMMNGKGYAGGSNPQSYAMGSPGNGPGGGGSMGGGAGYSDYGSNNSANSAPLGLPYGSAALTGPDLDPVTGKLKFDSTLYPGSGGASGSSGSGIPGDGGDGGGIISISARNVTVLGQIISNGENGSNRVSGQADGGGGGSGGSILIETETLILSDGSASGTLSAKGGIGGTTTTKRIYDVGGAGATGRIRVATINPIQGTGTIDPPPFLGSQGFLASSPFDTAQDTNGIRRLWVVTDVLLSGMDSGVQLRTSPDSVSWGPWFGVHAATLTGDVAVNQLAISVDNATGFSQGQRISLTDLSDITRPEPLIGDVYRIKNIQGNVISLDSHTVRSYSAGSVLTDFYKSPLGIEEVHPDHYHRSQSNPDNDRWIQYRVFLSLESGFQGPTFKEIRIDYLPEDGTYQPDGVIDGSGDGIYGALGSGGGGTSAKNVDPGFVGGQVTYDVKIQNDGSAPSSNPLNDMDTYTVTYNTTLSDASGDWTVSIPGLIDEDPVLGGIQVTVRAGDTKDCDPIDPDKTCHLIVTPSPYAPANSIQDIIINSRSENELLKVDSVRARATVNPIYQADGKIEGDGEDIRDATGTGNGGSAFRTAAPGDTVAYALDLQNEGNIQDRYTFSQTSSCGTDSANLTGPIPLTWKVLLNDGTNDYDITSTTSFVSLPQPDTQYVPATLKASAISTVRYTLKVLPQGDPLICKTVLKIGSVGKPVTSGDTLDPAGKPIIDSLTALTDLARTYRVDLWIEGNHGDNIYGAAGSGAGGSYSKGIPGGTTGTFNIGVQNEGNVLDSYELSWNTPAGWTSVIIHQDGSILCNGSPGGVSTCLVPPSDLDCPYKSGSQCLTIPGEVIPLKLQLTPPATFTSGDQSIIMDGRSMTDPTKMDSVQARVWANALTLHMDSRTATSVTLSWTDPPWEKDAYDLRVSTSPISEASFMNASAIRVSGNTTAATITQLYGDTPYHFAVKTMKGALYTSSLSVCDTSFEDPATCRMTTLFSSDAVSPATVTDLNVTAAMADSVTLCWTAPSDDTGDPNSGPVTGYILKYDTRGLVDDGVTLTMGQVIFSDARTAQGLGIPKSPGSEECNRIQVKNILAGPDGVQNTPDDIDRTPNTQFFFALKSDDENRNLSPLSNVAQGLTAMSSNTYNMVSVPKVPDPATHPAPYTPAEVFEDDVGSPLYLYWWDSRGVGHDRGCYDGLPNPHNPNNELPACTQISAINEEILTGEKRSGIGKGYFLWSPRLDVVLDAPAGSIDTQAISCTDELDQNFPCYVFPLQDGWNKVGNPFGKEVDVSAIKVRQTKQQGQQAVITTVSFIEAVTAKNWMGNAIYTYNGVIYTYEICDNTGCVPVLQPWKAYWIWLHKQGDVAGDTTYDLLIPSP